MTNFENNKVIDTANTIGELVKQKFGQELVTNVDGSSCSHSTDLSGATEAHHTHTDTAILTETGPIYQGMAAYPKNRTIFVVPTAQNMDLLGTNNHSEAPKVFGIFVDGTIRPCVVTPRSTVEKLDIAYLHSTAGNGWDVDQIDLLKPVINPDWSMLLKQAAAVQNKKVGASHDMNTPMGSELGHAVLATTSLLRPNILDQGHIVHEWTEGKQGIAVETANLGTYNVKTDHGTVNTRISYLNISSGQAGFLLKIPELDQSMDGAKGVSGANLTLGLGLVAIQTQLETDAKQLTNRLLSTMEKL